MSKVFNNWKVVLLSFVGATTFWFFNALNKNYDARISYPIQFVFDRDSVVVMEPLPTVVTIDVSSGGWNLLRKTFWFNVSPIIIELDNPAEISYYTRSSLLPLVTDQLSELRINYLVTDTLHINIEEKEYKKVALRLDSLAIPLAENFRLTSPISISPDTVELAGPESFIDTLGGEYYISPDASEIDESYESEVQVQVPDKNLISSKPEEVKVSFDVGRFDRLKTTVPVEVLNFPEDSSIYLAKNKVDVIYTIARSKRDDFAASDFAVTADLSMLNRKDSTVMIILMFYPEQVVEIEVVPEHIKVVYDE